MRSQWQPRRFGLLLTLLLVSCALVISSQRSYALESDEQTQEQAPPPNPRHPPRPARRPPPPPRPAPPPRHAHDDSTSQPNENESAANSGQVTQDSEPATAAAGAEVAAASGSGNGSASEVTTAVSTEDAAALLQLLHLLHEPGAEHVEQADLLALVATGETDEAFAEAFEMGDELFETRFNALDGVGANVGNGMRFSLLPRADLDGADQWANHIPTRITGPNAEACNDCHGTPFDDGAGPVINSNTRDPLHSGNVALFIQRNTPHTFGAGAVQVLAEEMTEALHALRTLATSQVCASGQSVTQVLRAKGVDFGQITVRVATAEPCTVTVDATHVQGVDADLVVRPFQWKGVVPTIRAFNRDASHQELGMQSVEIVGAGVDGDYDGVVDELTVGDQTALAVYLAAQPRPTTLQELATLGLIEPLISAEETAIVQGEALFDQVGCADCHQPQMVIQDPVFHEPSLNPNYRDAQFPAGQDPVALGVDPAFAVAFDLTQDQPDNLIETDDGLYRLGSLTADGAGGAVAAIYGDLKRHDMGPGLAEAIDDEGIPASVFLTENLWGVGSTAPYLHDGRATTLGEAILAHGGEAAASRAAFVELDQIEQGQVIAFLNNLVLYKQ